MDLRFIMHFLLGFISQLWLAQHIILYKLLIDGVRQHNIQAPPPPNMYFTLCVISVLFHLYLSNLPMITMSNI